MRVPALQPQLVRARTTRAYDADGVRAMAIWGDSHVYQHKRSDFRNIWRRFAGTAALAAIATSAAWATPENPYAGGSRLPHETQTIDRGAHETRRILKEFAQCNVKAHRDDVRRYLLEDVGEAEEAILRDRAVDASCLDREVGDSDLQFRLTGVSLQGALAEQMLSAEGLLSRPLDVAAIAPLRHPDRTPEELKKLDAAARAQTLALDYVFRFGECVVRANPAASAALLRSEPDSAAENAAFGDLMPAFRSCVELNRTLTADKIEIRGAVAYNYYRLASAPRLPTPISATKAN